MLRELAAHMFEFGATIVVVAAVPIVAYAALVVVGIVFQGDPGGWLNFIVVPVGSLLLGLLCATAFVPLSLISLRLGKASIFAPIAITVLAFGAWEIFIAEPPAAHTIVFHAIGGTLAFAVGVGFLVYLSVLVISRKILVVITRR